MNKYILVKGILIELDTETLDTNIIHYGTNINNIYFIEKDGILTYNNKEYNIKAGDTLLQMYSIGNEEAEIIIINSKELTENYKRRKKYYEKVKSDCCECNIKGC